MKKQQFLESDKKSYVRFNLSRKDAKFCKKHLLLKYDTFLLFSVLNNGKLYMFNKRQNKLEA